MKVIDKILRIYRKYHQTSENDRAKAINYTYDKAKKIALDITYIRYFQSLLSRLSNHIDRNEIRLTDDFIIIKTTNKKSDGRSQDTEKASIANVTTSVKKTNTYYRSPTMTSNVDIVKDAARHAEEL